MKVDRLSLKELLTVSPEDTLVRFLGQRVVLFDVASTGLLRKELIDTLGLHGARTVLTRFGYAHGWRTAKMLGEEFPDLVAEGYGGAHLHKLFGQFNTIDLKQGDGLGAEPLIDATVLDSYEVEQHLLLHGKSEGSICWSLTGFASGYESYKHGREVYFIEDKCCAAGDSVCHMVGRFKENWGPELDEHLPYYAMDSADALLVELTEKLRETEQQLRQRQRQLGFLSGPDEVAPGFIVRSDAMKRMIDLAGRVALVDSSILISGESGVGKERISQYIHSSSARSARSFVAVNCAALTETLLESELFGHVRGAYTDANRDRIGLFEEANGGTIFLDEIGEVSPAIQVKLLRVLQEKEVRRVGENRSRPLDVRVIAATNKDLAQEVKEGRFREDLFYRLRVIELNLPPLRVRSEDILPMACVFLRQYSKNMGRKIAGFTPKASALLMGYHWPGNVRELQNAVERAVALCPGEWVEPEDLPFELHGSVPVAGPGLGGGIKPLEEVEKDYILAALNAVGGDKRRAAEELKIGLSTLYKKLKSYGVGV